MSTIGYILYCIFVATMVGYIAYKYVKSVTIGNIWKKEYISLHKEYSELSIQYIEALELGADCLDTVRKDVTVPRATEDKIDKLVEDYRKKHCMKESLKGK